MPGINHAALDTLIQLGLDVLNMRPGEWKTFTFKDETMTLYRVGRER
jgi:hypothetical protein